MTDPYAVTETPPRRRFGAWFYVFLPVLLVGSGVLWLFWAPEGVVYEFRASSRTVEDSLAPVEARWAGVGGDRWGGPPLLRGTRHAFTLTASGDLPHRADTSRATRERSDFRTHTQVQVIGEGEKIAGLRTQQRLIVHHDTLYVTTSRAAARDEGADEESSGEAELEARIEAEVDSAVQAAMADVARAGSTTGARGAVAAAQAAAQAATQAAAIAKARVAEAKSVEAHARAGALADARGDRRGASQRRERRLARVTRTETYVWTTTEIPRAALAFELFADSLKMLGAHRSVRAIRSAHDDAAGGEGPFRGQLLRMVSTAVSVDSLGRRSEVLTRGEITSINRSARAIFEVHRRRVAAIETPDAATPPTPPTAPTPPTPAVPAVSAVPAVAPVAPARPAP